MADSGSSRPRSAVRSVSTPRPGTPPIPSSTPPSSSSRCGPPPASGGHLHAPAKGSNSYTGCERKKPNNRDVGKLVDAYRNIQMLSWPLIMLHEFISAVFSWEYPILTIGIWITLQLFFFYMTSGQILVLCFLMLFVIASLGYLSYTSQQLTEKHNSSKKQNFGIHLTTNSTSSSSLSSSSSSTSTSPSASSHVQSTTSGSTNQKVTQSGDFRKAKVPVSSSPPKNATSSLPSSLPKGEGCLATIHHDKKKHAELEIESHRRRELLTEYRQMMQDLSRWLTMVSSILVRMEELLLWRCRWKTIIFYLTLHISVLCIMYLPFRWITMATTNWLLLSHPQCYKGFEKMKKWVTSKINSKDMSQDEGSNHLNNSQDKERGSYFHKDGVVSSHPLEDVNANEDTDEEVQGETGKRGTQITVSASMGLDGPASSNQQQQHQPKKFESGMCYLCGTLFTSVLKRRRYCRYCGRDFCPKCCSKKLPRSVLGATAPAAQTEKELVCNLCIIKLTGEEVGGSKVR